jgi:catechol 2,3-dioxygenase-like lactoylglutathione lyase family enzyme
VDARTYEEGRQVSAEASGPVRFEAVVPQFTVPDVVGTAEYYQDVLGFQITGYWDGERASVETEPPPVFGIVERDQVQIFFNQAGHASPRTGRAAGAYDAYLRVRGLDALAAELRARGAEILDGPEERSYGQRELVVRDCNGLILAFGEDIQRGDLPAFFGPFHDGEWRRSRD